MRTLLAVFVVGLLWVMPGAESAELSSPPIALHPDNPHYLIFRSKPTLLIGSGEHYGAVLNGDFDYVRYLDAVEASGLNLTRLFSGTYREIPGSFNIAYNTLAPASAEKFICPWARSDQPGAGDGGNKFDLGKWNDAYFTRLKDFVAQAGKRGVVVEVVLFCTVYDDALWAVNPMNPKNNVNGLGEMSRAQVLALHDPKLTDFQMAFVRKVVSELRDADNVYFEVCNEPYFAGVSAPWQERVVETIVGAEKDLPHRHLIAQNINNGSQKVENPNPRVSIFNFHYCNPPDAVAMNRGLNRVIGDDETGFKGTGDFAYRAEAWDFILAGGAIYSNLDYSFTVKHPDGTFFPLPEKQPGGGGPELRKQLAILKKFVEGFDFIRMTPDDSVVRGGLPNGATARVLVEKGKAYAVYVRGGEKVELQIELPSGDYAVERVNTRTGARDKVETFNHPGGARTLSSPPYSQDIAVTVRRK